MGGRFNQEHLHRSEVGSDYQNEPDSDQSTNGSDLWKVNWLFFQNLNSKFFLKNLSLIDFIKDEWNRMIDASKIWDPKNEWECGKSPLSPRWNNDFPDFNCWNVTKSWELNISINFIVIKIVFLQPRQLPGLWWRWGRWDKWWETGWTQCFPLVHNF